MNSTTRKTLKTCTAAAALLCALATGARAADVPQVHVKFADLDLHTAAGVDTLNRRIRAAAQQVCGPAGELDLSRRARINACTERAVAGALAAVKSAGVQVAALK